ncbi:hypothetical protein HUE87_04505 [Candidatus Sulfurimonas marisnigri]|uniref:ATP-dependent nuclease subunit B n=1 Tax=Candidatus Sulfurimonas marisnigri TaxID=2740405 RepID=A0A7S7M1R2_9BACT|nr:hypothetical protein [Candidatus Sulfurimonas marisnigri]QOY55501.1 hypothetical protein HUE87_04505 [Candidatus Sulfurimonas marisnigri]
MFNYVKLFTLFVLLTILSGCGARPSAEIKGHEKIFENEDLYIMFALRAEQIKDYNASSSIFNTLYKESNKDEYFYRSVQNDLAAGENYRAIARIDKVISEEIENFALVRLKIIALIKLDRIDEAKELAIKLVEKSKEIDDYLLVSEIYVKEKEFDLAVKYLESAYIKDFNEKILDKIAIVLYVNLQRKKDAIAQLESHSRIRGCTKLICARLIGFYSNENNIDGLLSTYLRVYKIDSNKEIAKKIVQIYGYKKEYLNMMNFLVESKTDNELLLQLFIQLKEYKKASLLAEKLYKEGADIAYLGQSAIFEYESSSDKNDKKMQKSIIRKLEDVIKIRNEGLYLNYLGYLLIDHEIDVEKGIYYVKEALKIEANSAYYLDSLAWGYYKLGKCKRAKKIIDKVAKMKGNDNPEVIKHIKMIKNCKKGKNKK